MGEKYLVTGGGGFVGSHLTEALLAAGHDVTVLDTFSTGQMTNLAAAFENPRFHFVQGSVFDEHLVDSLVHNCDVVVHLAAAVGVRLIVDHPLRSLTTNIRGSEIVLEAAVHYCRKILLASTSEIYGKNEAVPLAETADCVLGAADVPRWAYSTAKAVSEILAFTYHYERGLPAIVVRLFNTVGPRQSAAYGMVIPRLVRQAMAGEPLTVYGDGSQTRCFGHVADVVDGFIRLMNHPQAIGQMFNIGTEHEVTILELARRGMSSKPAA
jgi:UDP-glucose 4-epimerase